MMERSMILRHGVRATTGLIIAGVAATAVVLLSTLPLPTVDREPVATTVSTTQSTVRNLICAGPFSELGADPERPNEALPVGEPGVLVAGEADETGELEREEGSGSLPTVFESSGTEPLGAAQKQRVSTDTVRGVTANICADPVNEQWLVGGDTTVGTSTTLSIGNAGEVPATVQITLYDEEGQVDAVQTTGVLVPPQSERTVSINGYAPGSERLAVHVASTGAPVTASLGVGETVDIRPVAADTASRQLSAETTLIVPGVTNVADDADTHEADDDQDHDPVIVRMLAPGDDGGNARVEALTPDGGSVDLGEHELEAGVVGDLSVDHWPEDANAVRIEAEVPVVAGVQGKARVETEQDYTWFAPAPLLPSEFPIAAPIVSDGQLVLVNPGSAEVTATLRSLRDVAEAEAAEEEDAEEEDAEDAPEVSETETAVPAGAAIVVEAPRDAELTLSGPAAAGVRVIDGPDIAGYPILPGPASDGTLTVYLR